MSRSEGHRGARDRDGPGTSVAGGTTVVGENGKAMTQGDELDRDEARPNSQVHFRHGIASLRSRKKPDACGGCQGPRQSARTGHGRHTWDPSSRVVDVAARPER